jgi:hypothetical protein
MLRYVIAVGALVAFTGAASAQVYFSDTPYHHRYYHRYHQRVIVAPAEPDVYIGRRRFEGDRFEGGRFGYRRY